MIIGKDLLKIAMLRYKANDSLTDRENDAFVELLQKSKGGKTLKKVLGIVEELTKETK